MRSILIAIVAVAAFAGGGGSARGAAPPDPPDCRIDEEAKVAANLDATCDAAIAAEKDPRTKAELLFRRAYQRNEAERYEEAMADLDEAKRLDPSNPKVLHERGYTLGSLGRYREAVVDLDLEAKLNPNDPRVYQERAYSRFPLGDLEGVYADRDREVALAPDDVDAIVSRAGAARWLGRFELAKSDLDLALIKAGADPEIVKSIEQERRLLTLWSSPTPGPSPERNCVWPKSGGDFAREHLIGDCTVAYFKAASAKDKAAALELRAVATVLVLQDESAGTGDKTIAVALEPDNPDWLSNLGFDYLSSRHSWGAEREFDRSIALKASWAAYAGRASARFNLQDFDGAFADAKKSFEIQPNEGALMVLGDLALERLHDPASAKLYWMGAYRLGSRDDGLIARLKSVGVTDPEKEPRSPPK
jgi:tetratricopeptide (TPR) repeat protein